MNIKILMHSFVFVLFFLGIYRYFVWKSKKCENKECRCPINDNLIQGYLVAGGLALIALVLLFLVELYIK